MATAAVEPPSSRGVTRPVLSVCLLTTGYLFGGLVVGMGLGGVIGAPAHVARNTVAGLVAVGCMTVAGSLWGRALARHVGRSDATQLRRATRAGAASFGPVTIGVAMILTALEPVLVGRATGPVAAIHVIYGFLFVPAASIVAGLTTWIMSAAVLDDRSARRAAALRTAAATGVAYLAIYLLMDLAGWRVGAPGAARRATMLVVTGISSVGACLAGSLAFGRALSGAARLPRHD